MSSAIYNDETERTDDLEGLGLTEEERGAVKPDEEEGETPNDEQTDEATDEATNGPEAEAESANDGANEDKDAPPKDEVDAPPKDEVDAAFAPQFTAGPTEGLQERLDEAFTQFSTQSDALAAQYEDGSLSFSEYRKQDRELATQYEAANAKLQAALLKAEIAQEHSRQSASQKWEMEQAIFFQGNEAYKADAVLRGALSAQLEQLYGDEANTGRSGLWFLREAGKLVDARFNRTPGVEQGAGLDKAKDAQRKRSAKSVAAPTTLAGVPAAGVNDDGGEFAHLDKLNGLDFEKALIRLTPDQYDRYMAT